MVETQTNQPRFFFALWPDESVRQKLSEIATKLQTRCGGRIVSPEHMHLTLAFLGQVDDECISCLKKLASEIQASPFSIQFNKAAYWLHNRIAWYGVESTPSGLISLVNKLRSAIKANNLSLDERDYVPHITLLRSARCADEKHYPDREVNWDARDFVLVKSESLNHCTSYNLIEKWQLKA